MPSWVLLSLLGSAALLAVCVPVAAQSPTLRATLGEADADAPPGAGDPFRPTQFGDDGAVEPEQPQDPEQPSSRRRPPAGQGSALVAPRAGPPRLEALQPYPTSQRLLKGAAVDTLDPVSTGTRISDPTLSATNTPGTPVFGPSVAALPRLPGRRGAALADLEPFAPLGYTYGALRVLPSIEQSIGFDSNPDQVSAGTRPSAFSRTEGGLSLLSLWSDSDLKAVMHAGYDEFFSAEDASRPDAAGTVDYRYTVTRDLALDANGRFAIATQRPGSPELNSAVQGRPLISSFGTTVGATETLGRLSLGLHGLFDRTDYENGRLGNGTVVPLATQNFNDSGLALRADYQLTPTLRPFGEVTLDTRVHDTRFDLSGYARDSDGIVGRLGTTFELTPLITGTVSAGYEDRSYADKRLKDLRGPVVDATVVYAVTPLTTLTLLASTSFDETNLAGSPGVQSRSVSLQVSHALLRNVTLTGVFGYLNSDYIGSTIEENTYSATLRASYALSRSLVLDATYNYQTLSSTFRASNFTQNVLLVGLRLQH